VLGKNDLSENRYIPVNGIRKIMAERMSLSKKTIPHFSVTIEVDASQIISLQEKCRLNLDKKKFSITFTDILIKIVSIALRNNSIVNSKFENERIVLFSDINVGVATATKNGLIVPVVRQADKKSLKEIACLTKSLYQKAREGKLCFEDVSNGTFTLSNLGMFGIDIISAIINSPQSGILAVGQIVKRPICVQNEIVIKPMMYLNLAGDHRVLDGVSAAKFLGSIKQLIMEAEKYINV